MKKFVKRLGFVWVFCLVSIVDGFFFAKLGFEVVFWVSQKGSISNTFEWSQKRQFGAGSEAWDVLPKIAKQKVVTLGDPGCGHPAKYKNKDCQRKEVRFLGICLKHLDSHNS